MTTKPAHWAYRQTPAWTHTLGPGWATILGRLYTDLVALAPGYQQDALTGRVDEYHGRTVRDVPVDGSWSGPGEDAVDDFALRRWQSYATIVINAETSERIEVLPRCEAASLGAWLRGHPGIEAACRDGSATYAETVRRALPDAVQVSDRRHLWHNLAEAVRKEVAAHSTCWAKGDQRRPRGGKPPPPASTGSRSTPYVSAESAR
ncbi:transposase [Streptomyces albidoflavus]|uniref:transposase n=1 Tax=Streptomyces albidoflavus TaxID=1886 RepID=UPI0038D2111E